MAFMAGKKKKKENGNVKAFLCHLFGTLILVAVIAALVPITVPRFMGYEVFNVVSGSMEPEIPVGSVAYIEPTDPVELEEGDVISFNQNGSVILHRVVSNHQVEGYLITKGDANEQEDLEEVPYQNVRGREVRHIPVLGQLMMILSSTVGKVLLFTLALCGALLNILAGRYR